MDPTGNPQKISLSAGLSLIEKAQELRWTIELATAVLFADLVLAWRTGQGIVHWSIQADQLLANTGFVLVSVLAYGVLKSAVVPLAAEFFRNLLWLLLVSFPWPQWLRTKRDNSRPVGGVLPSELQDYAYKKNDPALLAIYSAHQKKKTAEVANELSAGQSVFGVLTLGFANYFPSWLGVNGITLLREFSTTFTSVSESALWIALCFGLVAIKMTWFSPSELDWIHYPPLYEEIQRRRRQQDGIS